jgi:hypothetical protein
LTLSGKSDDTIETKKPTKRSGSEYPGLDKGVNGRKRWEYLDCDYADKLSAEERKYLSDFTDEYLSGNFSHSGPKIHTSENWEEINDMRLECYDRNNARNRCILSEAKALGRTAELDAVEVDKMQRGTEHNAEDIIIDRLDNPNDEKEEL